jgi:hypothetical protein
MFHHCLSFLVILLGTGIGALAQGVPVLYYPLDEGRGKVAADASGNKLDGVVSADWTDSSSGKALSFDGQPAGIMKVQLPFEKRFGTDSWTFSAWIKPQQFTIDDPQNQRRLFAFGTYPDAYLVIDILSTDQLCFYFCYRPGAADVTVSAGGSSAARLGTNQWAHVALVCDRKAGQVEIYINGFSQGVTALSPGFAGDFSLGGELTLGSGWHNYWGFMDEVKVYRRALARTEAKAEFARLKATFGVTESSEAAAAEKRELLMDAFAKTHEAWASGDYAAARASCAGIIASPEAPPSLRSYADLRSAQSYVAEGKSDLARTAYGRIATNTSYPLVHRGEASECEAELERNARGLPSRDPAASRTTLPRLQFAARVFVSPKGNDSNDGAATSPVATLTRARDRVRAMKAAGTTGAIGVAILPASTGSPGLWCSHSRTPVRPKIRWFTKPSGRAKRFSMAAPGSLGSSL